MKKFFIFMLLLVFAFSSDKIISVEKESCVMFSDYKSSNLKEIQKILLEKAKQEAIGEIYGQLLYSKTYIKNGKLISDDIRNRIIGIIRLKGNPKFFNGKNLGEICVKINAYATKDDLNKFKPKKVVLKHFCYTNPDVPVKEIEEKAKYAAFKKIVLDYNPKLKISGEQASEYIHEFQMKNNKFDFNTMSYCFDATAEIYPYEIQLTPSELNRSKQNVSNSTNIKQITKKSNINYPPYFDNYVWEGKITKLNDNFTARVKMFFLNKEKTIMMIIFFENNKIYTNIFNGAINGIKVFYKKNINQILYNSDERWGKVSGILIGNQIKGIIYDNRYNILLKKTNTKVKDYFIEIWIGKYDTTKFKNGKIILLRNDEIRNYWADMYPTENERGTETFEKVDKNGIVTFSCIEGYDPIKGYGYDNFSFTGSMISPNKFLGAGTGNFVTKIELTRVK